MRVVNVLDVIRCGKETSVVVKTSSGSAKIVPLNNRNWCDPKVKFSDSERGNLISLNTEASWDANAYVRIIGQISPSQLKVADKIMVTQKSTEPEYCYVPRPGTVIKPRKRKLPPLVQTVIEDEGSFEIPEVLPVLRESSKTFIQKFISSVRRDEFSSVA
jgi:hypothetical protein